MKLKYFAWLRESMGCDEEIIALPAEVKNVGMLLDWLAMQEERYERALEFDAVVKIFVNQRFADRNHAVCDDDEVFFVPPIAGG
jgi:molybdopterin synthase sulfur carrier subunit